MADETLGLTEDELLAMLEGGAPEDEGGLGVWPWLAAGGAGAYVGTDPYRRQLLDALVRGPQRVWGEKIKKPGSRGELWEAVKTGQKERWKGTKNPFSKRGERIAAGRAATVQQLGAGTKAGKELGKRAAQGATFGGLKGGAKGIGKMLGAASGPLGWLFAALMAYDFLLKPGWNALTKEPREATEALAAFGDQFRSNAAMGQGLAAEESLNDQLEAIASAQAATPKPIPNELKDILQGHYLPPLFSGAQRVPQPSFQQALSMVGGL